PCPHGSTDLSSRAERGTCFSLPRESRPSLTQTCHPDSSPSPAQKLSSRPERPDFLLRAELWRVGPRSGGIAAQSPRLASPLAFRISLFDYRCSHCPLRISRIREKVASGSFVDKSVFNIFGLAS